MGFLMGVVAIESSTRLVDRVERLLQRVDYRRADTDEQRAAIFKLRYDAYLREGAIGPNLSEQFSDPLDDRDNVWIYGVYIDDQLASSIRLSITIPGDTYVPAVDVFGDVLLPEIMAGKRVVDPTRFVADKECSRAFPELPYVTVRLPWLASDYFNADLLLAAVRREHQAFYKRTLGHQPVCEARPYPKLQKPISLMSLNYKEARDRVHQRYPFFRSNHFERRMLFDRHVDVPHHHVAAA